MYALDISLWITASLLCAAEVLILWLRGRIGHLPIFSFYLGFSALTNPVGLAIRSPAVFEWFVFSVSILGFVLELAVIYELANRVFLDHSALGKTFRAAPRWSAAALFLLVTVIGALLPQHARSLALQAYSTLSLSLNLMDLALLVALLVVTRLLALSWCTLAAGAALGIAITDSGCAAGAILLAQLGHPRYFIDFIRVGSFDVAGLVWLLSVCRPEIRWDRSKTGPQSSVSAVYPDEVVKVALAVKCGHEVTNSD